MDVDCPQQSEAQGHYPRKVLWAFGEPKPPQRDPGRGLWEPLSWWTFRIVFLFVCSGRGKGESRGAGTGGGSIFYWKWSGGREGSPGWEGPRGQESVCGELGNLAVFIGAEMSTKLWEANLLGEPRGGLCPSDCDPPELSNHRSPSNATMAPCRDKAPKLFRLVSRAYQTCEATILVQHPDQPKSENSRGHKNWHSPSSQKINQIPHLKRRILWT